MTPIRPVCPLCGSDQTVLLERIPVAEIESAYQRFFGFSALEEFKGHSEIDYRHCRPSPSEGRCSCNGEAKAKLTAECCHEGENAPSARQGCRLAGCDLRFFSPALPGSPSFYEKIGQLDWYYLEEKNEFSLAAKHVAPQSHILEIGAGRGAFARLFPSAQYVGLEFNDEAIRQGAAAGISLKCETVQQHRLTNSNAYDVVCAFQVLEHVDNPADFIQAAVACLKPGGFLILSVPAEDSFLRYATNSINHLPPHHLTRWTDQALRSIGRLFDLNPVEIIHEELQPAHIEDGIRSKLLSLLSPQPRVWRSGLFFRVIQKMIAVLAKVLKPLVGPGKLGYGHSVLSIFRKNAGPEITHANPERARS